MAGLADVIGAGGDRPARAITALAAFREARVRAVILRARPGARVLSAGHDIDE